MSDGCHRRLSAGKARVAWPMAPGFQVKIWDSPLLRSVATKGAQGGNFFTQALDFQFLASKYGAQVAARGRCRLSRCRLGLLRAQRGQELQPKAETGPVPDDGCHSGAARHLEFKIHQVAWFERHTG